MLEIKPFTRSFLLHILTWTHAKGQNLKWSITWQKIQDVVLQEQQSQREDALMGTVHSCFCGIALQLKSLWMNVNRNHLMMQTKWIFDPCRCHTFIFISYSFKFLFFFLLFLFFSRCCPSQFHVTYIVYTAEVNTLNECIKSTAVIWHYFQITKWLLTTGIAKPTNKKAKQG